jgi:predicted NBD/HSP70 family sugar kinase
VPGEPLPADVTQPQSGSYQRLVGQAALDGLARGHGLGARPSADLIRSAVAEGRSGFLDAVADRLAVGVAAVTVVLDPGLIVLTGDVGRAGGPELAARVEEAVAKVCPTRPSVVVTGVAGNPVLRGALVAALEQAREQVFSDTV